MLRRLKRWSGVAIIVSDFDSDLNNNSQTHADSDTESEREREAVLLFGVVIILGCYWASLPLI